MGTTPKLALRYPEPTDEPDAPRQIKNLANDVETFLAPVSPTTGSAWIPYTPTFNASGSQPSVGTGGTREGAYTRIGRTIFGRFNIVFGSGGGSSAGTGHYLIGLPVPAVMGTAETILAGTGYCMHTPTANEIRSITLAVTSSTQVVMRGDAAFLVSNALPWVWVTGNAFRCLFTYEAAS